MSAVHRGRPPAGAGGLRSQDLAQSGVGTLCDVDAPWVPVTIRSSTARYRQPPVQDPMLVPVTNTGGVGVRICAPRWQPPGIDAGRLANSPPDQDSADPFLSGSSGPDWTWVPTAATQVGVFSDRFGHPEEFFARRCLTRFVSASCVPVRARPDRSRLVWQRSTCAGVCFGTCDWTGAAPHRDRP